MYNQSNEVNELLEYCNLQARLDYYVAQSRLGFLEECINRCREGDTKTLFQKEIDSITKRMQSILED
jgi:hypothetical protein